MANKQTVGVRPVMVMAGPDMVSGIRLDRTHVKEGQWVIHRSTCLASHRSRQWNCGNSLPANIFATRLRGTADGADVKPIVRHNVANLLFNEVCEDHARVSSYFTVVTHIGLDHLGRYRDTVVPDGDTWRIKHRKVSTDWAARNSTMARDI